MKLAALTTLVAIATAAPAVAAPTPTRTSITLQPGQRLVLTMEQVPRGEFSFSLRASGDGEKNFALTQQRAGFARFRVLDAASAACDGAAGTLFCTGVTTPAPALRTAYTFRVKNLSATSPVTINLRIAWRKITSAG